MNKSSCALTLKIDANSGQDMVVLLRHALYEIEQQLPAPHDAPVEVKNARTMASFSDARELSSVTKGNTDGSIGSYEFEFFHCSREYQGLEHCLLVDGYSKRKSKKMFDNTCIYTHPTLPAKLIACTPLAICDVPNDYEKEGVVHNTSISGNTVVD